MAAEGLWSSEERVIYDLQFYYVRMPKKLEVLDLSANLSHHIQTADLLPVQDLHGHLVLG